MPGLGSLYDYRCQGTTYMARSTYSTSCNVGVNIQKTKWMGYPIWTRTSRPSRSCETHSSQSRQRNLIITLFHRVGKYSSPGDETYMVRNIWCESTLLRRFAHRGPSSSFEGFNANLGVLKNLAFVEFSSQSKTLVDLFTFPF